MKRISRSMLAKHVIRWSWVISWGLTLGARVPRAAASHRVPADSMEAQGPRFEDSTAIGFVGTIGGPSLILIPGGEVAASRYRGLAQEISAQDPQISVFIAKFTRDYVTPWEVKPRIQSIVASMKRLGWQDPVRSTYMAAHSMGGILGFPEVEKLGLKGLILMASYLPQSVVGGTSYTTSSYPKPFLILGAEWDRRVDIAVQARAFADFREWKKNHLGRYEKVVGILPGASHMQFADGGLLKSDVSPTRSQSEVTAEIARIIGAFVRQQEGRGESPRDQDTLEDFVDQSETIFAPVFAAAELDLGGCEVIQKNLAETWGWDGKFKADLRQSFTSFAVAKPLQMPGGTWQVPSHLETPPNPFDLPGTPFGIPVALSCKLLLKKAPGSTSRSALDICNVGDRILAEAVEGSLSDAQRERLGPEMRPFAHGGRELASWPAWVGSPTSFTWDAPESRWESRSVAWKESLNAEYDLVSCKFTPPTRWLFYFMRDAHLTSLEGAIRL